VDTAVVVGLIALGASAITAFFTWRASKRAAEISDRTEDRAWVKDIKQDALDARKELGDARHELEALRKQVRTLSNQMDAMARETDYWISQYQLVHRTAWRDGMTLARLRQFIGPDAPPTPATR
jgi:hypothetical protein